MVCTGAAAEPAVPSVAGRAEFEAAGGQVQKTWTIFQHCGPNHLGLWSILQNCGPNHLGLWSILQHCGPTWVITSWCNTGDPQPCVQKRRAVHREASVGRRNRCVLSTCDSTALSSPLLAAPLPFIWFHFPAWANTVLAAAPNSTKMDPTAVAVQRLHRDSDSESDSASKSESDSESARRAKPCSSDSHHCPKMVILLLHVHCLHSERAREEREKGDRRARKREG